MSLTWAQIRQLYLQAVGDSEVGREEQYLHLSEGYREVASRVEVPELSAVDEAVIVRSEDDFVDIANVDFEIYALLDVYNVTGNYPMYIEPSGMTGRNRFLSNSGKPPSGSVTHWQRDGSRIWVRNTPSVDTTLRLRVRQQTPTISAAMLNDRPITPPQYDMAVVFAAVENFYNLHPKTETSGDQQVVLSQKYQASKEAKLAAPKDVRVEEDRAHAETMRLRGYRLRGRR